MKGIDLNQLKELQIMLVRINDGMSKFYNKQLLMDHGLIREVTIAAKGNVFPIEKKVILTSEGKRLAFCDVYDYAVRI